eukprot:1848226-Prymnesium_polylepis.1
MAQAHTHSPDMAQAHTHSPDMAQAHTHSRGMLTVDLVAPDVGDAVGTNRDADALVGEDLVVGE